MSREQKRKWIIVALALLAFFAVTGWRKVFGDGVARSAASKAATEDRAAMAENMAHGGLKK